MQTIMGQESVDSTIKNKYGDLAHHMSVFYRSYDWLTPKLTQPNNKLQSLAFNMVALFSCRNSKKYPS